VDIDVSNARVSSLRALAFAPEGLTCGTHFNNLDGETHITCQTCNYFQTKKKI
jgi:hypothetical protein